MVSRLCAKPRRERWSKCCSYAVCVRVYAHVSVESLTSTYSLRVRRRTAYRCTSAVHVSGAAAAGGAAEAPEADATAFTAGDCCRSRACLCAVPAVFVRFVCCNRASSEANASASAAAGSAATVAAAHCF
jgi:hypothetical protein